MNWCLDLDYASQSSMMIRVLLASRLEFRIEPRVEFFRWFTKYVSVVDMNSLLTVKTCIFRYSHRNIEMQGLCVYAEAWRTKTGGPIMP